ncbi:hypothetical protein DYD21_08580 [Rhodohalobacter sp. SW132]|uniref:hypothetical protein n=1 Tax=Rhodohalobacter sp. SW132 TaxID=2293433 RepID=UPI000E259784|nr:hypothetical protein [Rhodohalobacter sp. SW132]REL37826.1 hypothetical protein DYD21_08580 [Rhodohalobacter sp. SW132]
MNRHLILIFSLSFLFASAVELAAQQNRGQVDIRDLFADFGNLPAEYLDREPDHNYPHEYLSKKTSIRFVEQSGGVDAVIDHLVRIKIYSDDPLEIADAALTGIPVYEADNMEQVRNLEGVTYLPDGRTLRLDEDDISRSELNTRYNILEFEMPGAVAGAVLEYKYSVHRRYIEELPDFYFAHQVPVREASVTLQNERYLRYDAVTQHVDFDIEYIREEVDTSSVPLVFSYSRPEPILLEEWRAENVPPVDHTTYVSSVDDIRGKVMFMISEFGVPRQPLENSWELVAAQIRKNSSPENVVSAYTELMERGREIAGYFDEPEMAQDSIFRLVNETVQFNGMNAVFADDGLDHVLSPEPANQAEINMTLLTLLRGAGIEAYPLYISGRDFGQINRSFPSLYQFNRMLVHSRIGEKEHVMDASFRFSEPDLIPVESFNEQGFLLRENSHEWIEIRPDKSVFDLTIFLDLELSEEGHLSGTLRSNTRGYPAQQILSRLEAGESQRQVATSMFLDMYPEMETERAEIRMSEGLSREAAVEIDFTINRYATSFSDGLEFRPMVVGYLFRNPFESTRRRVPITLDAPENLMINYQLTMPDGYRTDGTAETRQTRLPGAELNERYAITGNVLRYSFEIDITRKEFPADMYGQLRRIYERWVDLSNSTWYLQKL